MKIGLMRMNLSNLSRSWKRICLKVARPSRWRWFAESGRNLLFLMAILSSMSFLRGSGKFSSLMWNIHRFRGAEKRRRELLRPGRSRRRWFMRGNLESGRKMLLKIAFFAGFLFRVEKWFGFPDGGKVG